MNEKQILLNQQEASNFLKISVATLKNRRRDGNPPRYVKIGRKIFYNVNDLKDFIEQSTKNPTQ